MKSIIILLGLFSSLVINSYGQSHSKIVVRGTAVREIEPETIEFSLIYSYSDNVKDNARITEQDRLLKSLLAEFSIPAENLIVDNISASGWGVFAKVGNTNISLTKTYRLRYSFSGKVESLIPKLVKTGADNVYVTNLESSKLDSIKRVTMLVALDNAKTKATEMANHVGGQQGAVKSIVEIFPGKQLETDTENNFYSKMSPITVRGVGIYQDVDIQSLNMRKIRVTTTYEVEYELK